ncbi:MAG: HD domain-containing protein [Treponema sp.]|nr:HD domain-containing protein [Treponema sp.]
MIKRICDKFKSLIKIKIIESIPPELQDQFDELQLKNSVRSIRILTIIAVIAKFINPVFILLTNQNMDGGFFDFIDYSEFAIIGLFNIAVIFFKKGARKQILWFICYLLIASLYILYEFTINSTGTVNQIPFIFFVTIFLFTILPDFKPKIFITFAILYFGATIYILSMKNQSTNEFFGVQSHVINIFLIIIITKILLYNGKVRTFVNTYKISKLNDSLVSANSEIMKRKEELRSYNDNLEKMVVQKAGRIVELKNAVMETIAELVERRDDTTGGHITRTSKYLRIFIDAILHDKYFKSRTASWDIDQMVLSAQLHDVGKIAIDDAILRKPGKLTNEEFDLMKKHTILGGDIIKEIQNKTGEQEFLDYAFLFAVYHHERWDGCGYPYGIKGEDIPLPARLMAIVDVYDALISKRPYKEPFTQEQALNIIKDGKGSHFDPALADLFISISDQFNK